jgi:hypothetical protein
MSFDLSRKKFNPLDDYLGVVMQQGRVQTDADWNTMVKQIVRRAQAESLDTFGPSVVPRETADGFLISGATTAFEIGPGRIYVDGVLAENHTDSLKWDARLAEISGTAKLSGADVDAAPTGLVGTTAYNDQPYYPNPPSIPTGENYLVYVDVWQRDITYLQDASLVDAAVGVDTTARQQTVWQVKFLDNIGNIDPTTADLDIPGWLETIHPSSARLSTATGDLSTDDNPCLLPPQAGYKGLENQLYRVQVHNGGPLGTATFKWSRDNAVVSSRISAIPGSNEIVVDSLGRDEVLRFNEGDWVEITDDHRDLMGLSGELRRIKLGDGIDSATRTITLEGAALPIGSGDGEFPVDGSDQTDPARNTRLIRWDQAGIVFNEDETEYDNLDANTSTGSIVIPNEGDRLFLEKGILVDFHLENVVDEADFGPEFKVGDYWIFSARVNDASIELLDRAPPEGIHHHYAKLAIMDGNGFTDCRTFWPPAIGSEGCACTVCVHPDTHNNGSATIQQAIDQVITQGGGTVCLGVGKYNISHPIRITGNSVTLRGQGWQSMLLSREPITLIEIGGEGISTDITVENILALTSTTKGFSSAITVNNVLGLNLNNCFIANLAGNDSTSQGIQFTGLAVMVRIQRCNLLAERGIVGPRLKNEFLGTMDFSLIDCLLSCSLQGISFTGLSFHINKLELSQNHISNSQDVGIELAGMVLDDTAVNIQNNLFNDCQNGIQSGISNVRILHNDLEVSGNRKEIGNAITFIDGLDPDDSDNQQVIGNRIRNYRGHAISVKSGIGKMMVKQNQAEKILGAAFIIETGGSVEYLSLENNQFTDIYGIIEETKGHFAAILLQASVRADISNNVFDSIVRSNKAASTRAGISIYSSSDVRISGNRLFAVTPATYTGIGAGIIISSTVGNFEVNDNEISRVPQSDDKANEELVSATWLPLLIIGASTLRAGVASHVTANFDSIRAHTGAFTSLQTLMTAAPVVKVNKRAYAILATRMVNLGAVALSDNSALISGNQLDGTSSTTPSVIIAVPMHCGFNSNEVISENSNTMVVLSADHVAANNNRLINKNSKQIMIIQTRRYVLMGNMVTGAILVNTDGSAAPPPEPWKSLNINI